MRFSKLLVNGVLTVVSGILVIMLVEAGLRTGIVRTPIYQRLQPQGAVNAQQKIVVVGDSFIYKSHASFGDGSVTCIKCNSGYSGWKCPSCSTHNPISKSIKECFIATAVYNGENTPEVTLLRSYRDNVLMQSNIGKLMVRLYERTSPPIAELAYSHNTIRLLLDKFIVTPAVAIVKHIYKA